MGARLVLELLGTRYADPAAADWLVIALRAEPGCVGPMVANGPDAPRRVPRHDQRRERGPVEARRTVARGHPLRPLVWLANFLAARDGACARGGCHRPARCAGAIESPMNESLTVTFGGLGAITTELVRAS